MLELEPEKIAVKSRLQPGKMLLVDTISGRLIDDDELKEQYATRQPYGEWLDQSLLMLKDLPIPNHHIRRYSGEERDRLYKAFGYTYEEVKDSILQMAQTGAEPTAANGRRHSACRAVREASAAVQLLQAAVRTGYQPAG